MEDVKITKHFHYFVKDKEEMIQTIEYYLDASNEGEINVMIEHRTMYFVSSNLFVEVIYKPASDIFGITKYILDEDDLKCFKNADKCHHWQTFLNREEAIAVIREYANGVHEEKDEEECVYDDVDNEFEYDMEMDIDEVDE